MGTGLTESGQHSAFTAVGQRLPTDLITPAGAWLRLRSIGARFLLESAASTGKRGRHSFIGFGRTTVSADGEGVVTLESPAGREQLAGGRDGLSALQELAAARAPNPPATFGLLGGAVGYITWDYGRLLECRPAQAVPRGPVLQFILVDSLVAFDHFQGCAEILTLAGTGEGEQAEARNRAIAGALAGPLELPAAAGGPKVRFRPDSSKESFEKIVERAREYIRAGDIFQVVLSRRKTAKISADPFQIYRALRMTNPSPYMFYLDFGSRRIVGASPEMLVKLDGDMAHSVPIAGTRGRGAAPEEDQRLARELLADEKECAEHVMLVDLARNDLGRCCRYGTVRVERAMAIEKFSHVQHMVSDVTGRVREDVNAPGLLQACFPAGTVSGAPKVRAMEIIDELEKEPRGPYAGCVGYLTPGGEMDTCITIRTAVVEGDQVALQAGAGIVADSIPAKEFEETERKMAVLEEAVIRAEEGIL